MYLEKYNSHFIYIYIFYRHFQTFKITIFNEHLMSNSKNVLISTKKYNCLVQVLFVNHFFVLQARLFFLHLEVTSDFYFPCCENTPPSIFCSFSFSRPVCLLQVSILRLRSRSLYRELDWQSVPLCRSS